ncbi:MAG: DedA family protein [Pseudomonadota bacterium]
MFDWILGLMAQGGYVAIALLMFVENLFPPIPSEVVMLLAGFLAASGALGLAGVVLAGTAGAVAGALFWYWIGRRIGSNRLRRFADRHGRWLTIDAGSIDRSHAWFDRYGGVAVLIGRMIPGIRTFISVPAGVARMPLLPFLGYTMAGSLIWTGFLTALG